MSVFHLLGTVSTYLENIHLVSAVRPTRRRSAPLNIKKSMVDVEMNAIETSEPSRTKLKKNERSNVLKDIHNVFK